MTKPSFVYVTYIRMSPEKLWQALTDGTVTRQYWPGGESSPTGRWARP